MDGPICYKALETISVGGGGTTFTVYCNGSVTFVAGKSIRFLPGTQTTCNGYLHGYISTDNEYCGQQTPALPATLTGEEEHIAALPNRLFTIYPNPAIEHFTLAQTGEMLSRTFAEAGPVY